MYYNNNLFTRDEKKNNIQMNVCEYYWLYIEWNNQVKHDFLIFYASELYAYIWQCFRMQSIVSFLVNCSEDIFKLFQQQQESANRKPNAINILGIWSCLSIIYFYSFFDQWKKCSLNHSFFLNSKTKNCNILCSNFR